MRPKKQTAAPRKAAGRPRITAPAVAALATAPATVDPAAAPEELLPVQSEVIVTASEAVDGQPEPTAEFDPDLIAMSKGDDTQRVHPTTVAAHKAVGWSIA